MNPLEQIEDDILNSLNNFTRHIDDDAAGLFDKMRECSFFAPVPSEHLAEIAHHSRTVSFRPGEKIITEQDIIRPFYILLFGAATAYFKHRPVGRILSGECLGESAFFNKENQTRSATVIADGEVSAIEMNAADIEALSLATRTCLDKALLLALFKKLQAANKQLQLHSADEAS